MKRGVLWTAALAAAVAVSIGLTLPPRQVSLQPARTASGPQGPGAPPLSMSRDETVAGAIHVHSNRSDGRSTPAEIAAAAERAGLRFVIVTDHGDGTRTPDPPTYYGRVLCIDGVEISTDQGHYVAYGLPAAPYRLGGSGRDVAEDVARLGGFGTIAHPDSPKATLRWSDWDAPFDAIEILNLDTSWRLQASQSGWRSKGVLFASLFDYPFRSAETIARLTRPPGDLVDRWMMLAEKRRVVGLAGTDAHAKLSLFDVEPGDNRFTFPIPGYEAAFRALAVHVTPSKAFTGEAAADSQSLLEGLRAGHVFTALSGIAAPASFAFTATVGNREIAAGDEAGDRVGDDVVSGDPVALHVRTNAPPSFTTEIWNGRRLLRSAASTPDFTMPVAPGPGVYRVQIRASDRAGAPIWLFSNPIYVREGARSAPPESAQREPASAASATMVLFDGPGVGIASWRMEEGERSAARMRVTGRELELRYAAAETAPGGVVAFLTTVPGSLNAWTDVAFTARADRPTRVSVQLRTDGSGGGQAEERWQQTVYVDASAQAHMLRLDRFTPIGPTQSAAPRLAEISEVLFVVTPAGIGAQAHGSLWLSDVRLQR